jgi:hypothetical protein
VNWATYWNHSVLDDLLQLSAAGMDMSSAVLVRISATLEVRIR